VRLAVVQLALICSLGSSGGPRAALAVPGSPDALLSDAIGDLVKGHAKLIAARIHEPKAWSTAEADKDRRAITDQLELLLHELGRVSSPTAASPPPFYVLEVAGADLPYWQSLPNRGIARTATYQVKFEKAGPGVIVVALTQASDAWQLRSIAFGIEMNRRGARTTMLRVARRLLTKMRPDLSKAEIDAATEAALGPEPGQAI